MASAPGPANDLIEHAAGIIVASRKQPHTAPAHWAGALWEAGMLVSPGTADLGRPTREQIASTLHAQRMGHPFLGSVCNNICSARYYAYADAVLALLNGK